MISIPILLRPCGESFSDIKINTNALRIVLCIQSKFLIKQTNFKLYKKKLKLQEIIYNLFINLSFKITYNYHFIFYINIA